MRAFKLIIAALFAAVAATVAIMAGVVAAAVVAGIGLAVYLSRRLLGRPAASRSQAGARVRPKTDTEAIEVSATDITHLSDAAEKPVANPALPPHS